MRSEAEPSARADRRKRATPAYGALVAALLGGGSAPSLGVMKAQARSAITLFGSLALLAGAIVFNYASNLAWSHGDSRNWPYLLATAVLVGGLVWCARAPSLSRAQAALLVIGLALAYLFGGFVVGLFCSCAMGDCI